MSEKFLKLHMVKSQILILCEKQKLINDLRPQIECLNNELQVASSVASCEILGVHLDSSKCFKTFMNDVCRSCHYKLNKLRNFCHFLSKDLKIMLVKCIAFSKLDYCNCLHLLNKIKKSVKCMYSFYLQALNV